jgi:hypothetical protein
MPSASQREKTQTYPPPQAGAPLKSDPGALQIRFEVARETLSFIAEQSGSERSTTSWYFLDGGFEGTLGLGFVIVRGWWTRPS